MKDSWEINREYKRASRIKKFFMRLRYNIKPIEKLKTFFVATYMLPVILAMTMLWAFYDNNKSWLKDE